MQTRIYSAAHGAQFSQADAPIIGAELERISKDGLLSIDHVLGDAEREDSRLHSYFEWDDTKAAYRWRRKQASDMISHIRVKIIELDEPVQAYPRIRIVTEEDDVEPEDLLIPIDVVKGNGVYLEALIHKEMKSLANCRDRLRPWQTLLQGLDKVLEGPFQETLTGLDEILTLRQAASN